MCGLLLRPEKPEDNNGHYGLNTTGGMATSDCEAEEAFSKLKPHFKVSYLYPISWEVHAGSISTEGKCICLSAAHQRAARVE